jgi:recombination associated protein RdgC
MLDAGSQARADEVITALVKAVDGLAMQLLQTEMSPAAAMSLWLSSGDAPVGYTVDQECELKAVDASRAVVRYTRHPLDGEEIPKHIQMGKVPTRLALSWAERVSFVLTDALQLKKIAFLDGAVDDTSAKGDGSDDRFDADVAIATGELRKLLPELMEALGGETPGG